MRLVYIVLWYNNDVFNILVFLKRKENKKIRTRNDKKTKKSL